METDERTSEDRATQSVDTVRLSFEIYIICRWTKKHNFVAFGGVFSHLLCIESASPASPAALSTPPVRSLPDQ